MNTMTMRDIEQALMSPERHARLLRLCAIIGAGGQAAEDLAQETLLEAWRHRDRVTDLSGLDLWLAAIARNVCHRWRRREANLPRPTAVVPEPDLGEEPDLIVELEREQLAELLDRALALLPQPTRDILIHRFVHDRPYQEIADRVGLSPDAVSMRVSRGKLMLRRVLESDHSEELAAYGFVDVSTRGWVATRVWCTRCVQQTLLMRRDADTATVTFRCPGCQPMTSQATSQFTLVGPVFGGVFGGVVQPAAILHRASQWSHPYFDNAIDTGVASCPRCQRTVQVRRFVRTDEPDEDSGREGWVVSCHACGEEVSCSLGGFSKSLPQLRAFQRDHRRIRELPTASTSYHGRAARRLSYQAVASSSRVDVFFAGDSLRLLAVHTDNR